MSTYCVPAIFLDIGKSVASREVLNFSCRTYILMEINQQIKYKRPDVIETVEKNETGLVF